MKLRMLSALIAGVMTIAFVVPAAHALSKVEGKCQATIAKSAGKFMKAVLKEKAKCADKQLKATGGCDLGKRQDKLDKAEAKLRSGLQKACTDKLAIPAIDFLTLNTLGFPGKCADADPSNGFTGLDMQDCIFTTHTSQANALFLLAYGTNGADGVTDFLTRDPTNGKALGKCQKELGKNAAKHLSTIQKEVSKCRDGLLKDPPKFGGFLPADCADNLVVPKIKEKIDKSRTKLIDKIVGKCGAIIGNAEMDACNTDQCVGGSSPGTPCTVDSDCAGGGTCVNGRSTTAAAAATCLAASYENATDDTDNSAGAVPFGTDLIDIEYALGAFCGDNLLNDRAVPGVFSSNFYLGEPREECDGTDAIACPGACGGPTSDFPCQCTNVARERVAEHETTDLDNGWTGTSHDSAVVEGGGYKIDVYDCDGPAGPDFQCNVGPHCAVFKSIGCQTDAGCPGADTCRKTNIVLGPHCNSDLQKPCVNNADCPPTGADFCRKTPHGIPLPLSSGGTAVCIVNVFSEDVIGTTNYSTGEGAVRLRQDSVTHIANGTLNQPCPTCGGYCAGASGGSGPGTRTLCAADSDCPASVTCVTAKLCSYGPNEGQACRTEGQFGGPTTLFGTPSVDCPPTPGQDISGGGLDILFGPSTTGSFTSLPGLPCAAAGFGDKKCIAGTEIGKSPCTNDGDCAGGGVGSCVLQCFCPGLNGNPQKPNDCTRACRGGTNDYGTCSVASDCPGGLCEETSCRLAAGVCTGGTIGVACSADTDCGVGGTCGDTDSSGEGFCPGGPTIGLCSFTTLKGCLGDSECRPSGSCDFCKGDNSETCQFKNKDCFPSAGYVRTGTPGSPDRTVVSNFCIPASASSAVNGTAGIPGPAAIEQPVTLINTF